ncbi:Protein kinase superfamily protein [Striga hermonthica]|uniref:non-specific serine/threonine protein kinase n=1 Tax=Striga hermonthica TaxID=68872 RepID=A0A9N7R6G2_STRHE|nr:Protein kinase superfamily protein [Striga hermonthica]
MNFAHKQYRYSDLKRITKLFKEKLDEGGYDSVYKGELPYEHLVAVKMLINESKDNNNGSEFINEVASIRRTSHVNIVTLLGFCVEDSKWTLVYEFMPNSSLDKYINNTLEYQFLGWEKLSEIALGVARGLEYLHQGCNTRIVHLDMMPHNILLDREFNPKILDFGLAKLCPNRSSIVSMRSARGTMGYIAPEVFCRNFGEV